MTKGRLEAFSDGVIAIIITIMVLELKVPHTEHDSMRCAVFPVFLSYVLSFIYVGIYWNNHHHLLHATRASAARAVGKPAPAVLVVADPVRDGLDGRERFRAAPTALYGVVLLMAALAYTILQTTIVTAEGNDSVLRAAIGHDMKGKLSVAGYLLAIAMAFVSQWLSGLLYVSVALMWLVPDRRIERVLADSYATSVARTRRNRTEAV